MRSSLIRIIFLDIYALYWVEAYTQGFVGARYLFLRS